MRMHSTRTRGQQQCHMMRIDDLARFHNERNIPCASLSHGLPHARNRQQCRQSGSRIAQRMIAQ